MLHADCVLALHNALTIWVSSGDSPIVGWCPINLLLPDWVDPKLGVLILFMVTGAGVDVVVSMAVLCLVSPTAQIRGIMALLGIGNYYQGCRPILCKFGQHSFNYIKWGKDIQIKVWPTQRKGIDMICIWVRFLWCITSTFGIYATSKQIFVWFPKIIKKQLYNPLVKRPLLFVVKRRDLRPVVVFLNPSSLATVIQISCSLAQF